MHHYLDGILAMDGLLATILSSGTITLLLALSRNIFKSVKAIESIIKSDKENDVVLYRHVIISASKHCIDEGSISMKELDDINSLYEHYKELGGNGLVTNIVTRCNQLPIEKK